eukprot:6904132-Prymnesium_polylepis.1
MIGVHPRCVRSEMHDRRAHPNTHHAPMERTIAAASRTGPTSEQHGASSQADTPLRTCQMQSPIQRGNSHN